MQRLNWRWFLFKDIPSNREIEMVILLYGYFINKAKDLELEVIEH